MIGPAIPAPSLGGIANVAERDRVFQALFDASVEPLRLGPYLVQRTLGRGAMGTVFEAFDPRRKQHVAVKVLRCGLGMRHRLRLLREARALTKISHPNVVQAYEAGMAEDQAFIAMELVRGRSLAQWARSQPRPGWREHVQVYLQAGEALAAAHAVGLVHRDFKPENVMVDDEGRVCMLDFGLARWDEEADGPSPGESAALRARDLGGSLTETGAVLGTPAYMPLEQMKGEQADARSDQFAFCVSLYEALYGERPFAGSSMAALMLALERGEVRPAPASSKVPEALREVVLRGLARDPSERWPSMEPLLVALHWQVGPWRRVSWILSIVVGLALVGVAWHIAPFMNARIPQLFSQVVALLFALLHRWPTRSATTAAYRASLKRSTEGGPS